MWCQIGIIGEFRYFLKFHFLKQQQKKRKLWNICSNFCIYSFWKKQTKNILFNLILFIFNCFFLIFFFFVFVFQKKHQSFVVSFFFNSKSIYLFHFKKYELIIMIFIYNRLIFTIFFYIFFSFVFWFFFAIISFRKKLIFTIWKHFFQNSFSFFSMIHQWLHLFLHSNTIVDIVSVVLLRVVCETEKSFLCMLFSLETTLLASLIVHPILSSQVSVKRR